ncbi:hypothetical protein [Nocardia goodfellowii]|uniref:Tox-REase-7 domain-containing protein n=1 Tax=Nocardia goodfellowii TaxID=882446 RepID=A0ABS4QRK6_9NOCA|nr:hypothetical protein [Nocardia goodfellowii]MBP2194314.1 hypothetical protein [Nocardia goodfellowii]
MAPNPEPSSPGKPIDPSIAALYPGLVAGPTQAPGAGQKPPQSPPAAPASTKPVAPSVAALYPGLVPTAPQSAKPTQETTKTPTAPKAPEQPKEPRKPVDPAVAALYPGLLGPAEDPASTSPAAMGLPDTLALVKNGPPKPGQTVTLPSGTTIDYEGVALSNGLTGYQSTMNVPGVDQPLVSRPQAMYSPQQLAGLFATDDSYTAEQRDRDLALLHGPRTMGPYTAGALVAEAAAKAAATERLNAHWNQSGLLGGADGATVLPRPGYSPTQLANDLSLASTTGNLDAASERLRQEAQDRLNKYAYTKHDQDDDQFAAQYQYLPVDDPRRKAEVQRYIDAGLTPDQAQSAVWRNAYEARNRLSLAGIPLLDRAQAEQLENTPRLYSTDPRRPYVTDDSPYEGKPHKFTETDFRIFLGDVTGLKDLQEGLLTGDPGQAAVGGLMTALTFTPGVFVKPLMGMFGKIGRWADDIPPGVPGGATNGLLPGLVVGGGTADNVAPFLRNLDPPTPTLHVPRSSDPLPPNWDGTISVPGKPGPAPHTPRTEGAPGLGPEPTVPRPFSPGPGPVLPWQRLDPWGTGDISPLDPFFGAPRVRPGQSIPRRAPGEHGGSGASPSLGVTRSPAPGSAGDLVMQVDELYRSGMGEADIIAALRNKGIADDIIRDDQIQAVIAASRERPGLLMPGQRMGNDGRIIGSRGNPGAEDLPLGRHPLTTAEDVRPPKAKQNALEDATALTGGERSGMQQLPGTNPSPWDTASLADKGNVGGIGGELGQGLTRAKLLDDGDIILAEGKQARIPIPGQPGKYFEPDFIVMRDGKVVFVESKWRGGEYTAAQLEGYEAYRQGGMALVIDEAKNPYLLQRIEELQLDPATLEVAGVKTIRWNDGWGPTDRTVWKAANDPWPSSMVKQDGDWNLSLAAYAELNAEAARRAAAANNPAAYLYFQARSSSLGAVQALTPADSGVQRALASAVDTFSQRAAAILGGPSMGAGDAMKSLGFVAGAGLIPVMPDLLAPLHSSLASASGTAREAATRVNQSLTIHISIPAPTRHDAGSPAEQLREMELLGRR